MVKVILEMFGKELKIVNIPENQLEVHLAATTSLARDFGKIVPHTTLTRKLIFVCKGKSRSRECGCTKLPILEFEGVQ